jgi:hypothetical protein
MSEQPKHARDMTPEEFRTARAQVLADAEATSRAADNAEALRDVIIRHVRQTAKPSKEGS